MPSGSLARPMLSVDARIRVPSNRRSHSSMASQRSSRGERFHRSQVRHTTHRRPFAESNASRRPTGKCAIASLAPRGAWQKRQLLYKGPQGPQGPHGPQGPQPPHRVLATRGGNSKAREVPEGPEDPEAAEHPEDPADPEDPEDP